MTSGSAPRSPAIPSMGRSRWRRSTPASPPRSAGSADVVLTFRNVHSWLDEKDPIADAVFAEAFRVLKPGGTLGVVEHRLPEEAEDAKQLTSGYVKVSIVRQLAEKAGSNSSDRARLTPTQGHQGSSRGRLDASADTRAGRQGPRELPRHRRERPHDAEIRQNLSRGPSGRSAAIPVAHPLNEMGWFRPVVAAVAECVVGFRPCAVGWKGRTSFPSPNGSANRPAREAPRRSR